MSDICMAEDLLKKHDIALNPNRKLVLDILKKSPQALPPKTILEQIHKVRGLDKVTLYRILDLLATRKVLRKISTPKGILCYEINCQEHHPLHAHFICRLCGHLECLKDLDLNRWIKKIKNKCQMDEDIDLKVEGVCTQCQRPQRKQQT